MVSYWNQPRALKQRCLDSLYVIIWLAMCLFEIPSLKWMSVWSGCLGNQSLSQALALQKEKSKTKQLSRVYTTLWEYFLLLFFPQHLYWSIITLQWCLSFCCMTKWISHMYNISPYPLPLASPSHLPYPTHLGGHKAPGWSPCAMQLLPTSHPFYIW